MHCSYTPPLLSTTVPTLFHLYHPHMPSQPFTSPLPLPKTSSFLALSFTRQHQNHLSPSNLITPPSTTSVTHLPNQLNSPIQFPQLCKSRLPSICSLPSFLKINKSLHKPSILPIYTNSTQHHFS
jgi:hypothetical protein